MDAEDEAEVTEPRADYTIEHLLAADHAGNGGKKLRKSRLTTSRRM